jgi:hypothetical protein
MDGVVLRRGGGFNGPGEIRDSERLHTTAACALSHRDCIAAGMRTKTLRGLHRAREPVPEWGVSQHDEGADASAVSSRGATAPYPKVTARRGSGRRRMKCVAATSGRDEER